MNSFSATFTVFIGVCAGARVPFSGSASSNSSVLPMGLPLRNSRTPNVTANTAGNLGLPIDAFVFPDIETRFTFEPAHGTPLFEGGELITSIFVQISKVWKDVANAPIVHEIEVRDGPFSIWHTIQPALVSEAAALTPLRVGVAYSQMMRRVLQIENWPGQITADLYTLGPNSLHIGSISVRSRFTTIMVSSNYTNGYRANLAADGGVSVIIRSNYTHPQTSLLQTRAIRERAWLIAFAYLSNYVFRHAPLQRLLNPVGPFPPPHDYQSETFYSGAVCAITLKISRYAGDITWESVAAPMMDLIVAAATGELWDFSEQVAVRDPSGVDIIIISLRSLQTLLVMAR